MRDINSLNKVLLIGHLGRDPEVRYLPQSERAVARFTLATNERYFNPTTKESDVRTEWHRIVAWGKLAEFCEKFLNQGKQIYLEGKIKTRSWEDRDGNKRYTTEVIAQNIVFLGRKDDSSAETSFPDETAEESKEEEAPQNQSDNEEDIPF